MKLPVARFVMVLAVLTLDRSVIQAKPHANPSPAIASASANPSPAAASSGTATDAFLSLARGVLQQDRGDHAAGLPLTQVVEALSGSTLQPMDRKNPADAAFIQRLGGILDGVLPQMNKTDSPARLASHGTGMVSAFEDALATRLGGSPDVELTVAAPPHPAPSGGSYPALRVVDKSGGKTYYLGVSVFATVDRQVPDRAVSFHPGESANGFTTSGSGLLVSVETNGKIGKDAAFLNWELIDLARVSARAVMIYEGSQDAVHAPGARLDDGRKGRD